MCIFKLNQPKSKMLKDSINPIEIKMLPTIRSFFPNYEIFWDNFLTDGIGPDKHWKECDMEPLGIANCGVLKSLNYIRANYPNICVNDENQTFKNIYYHFGIICDIVPYCCRYLFEFLQAAGLRNKEFDFKSAEIEGSQVPKLLRHFIKGEDDLNHITEFNDEIQKYRHFFTHNPGIDIVTKRGEIWVIKRGQIDACRKLSSLRVIHSVNPEYVTNPIPQAREDLLQMLAILNSIWHYFIPAMETAKREKPEAYRRLCKL
jgi:hypothetical protein